MTAQIMLSYERDQERDEVLQLLRPLLDKAKIKRPKIAEDARFKRIYIQLGNLAGGDP
jgi:hypothetical protein